MRQNTGMILEPKRNNKIRTAKFISARGITSKAEIARALNLSMPTTLANVKELIHAGIVTEEGEYESTGGRRAKALAIRRDAGYAAGIDITNNHITMVMTDAGKNIIASERIRRRFVNDPQYYDGLKDTAEDFIQRQKVNAEKIAGIGFSLPGIVDRGQDRLLRSHTLQVENVSFRSLGAALGYPFCLENDANCAALAEVGDIFGSSDPQITYRGLLEQGTGSSMPGGQNGAEAVFVKCPVTVYLSLSNTVGGAIFLGNDLYRGENFKSAEFGHMVIEKNGRQCYCGKKGCMDAYCTALRLQDLSGGNLEAFFDKVRKREPEALKVWEEYLDHLALSVTNLRMIFDCRIILGGYVGGFLEGFMPELSRKVMEYNNFDLDTSYLSTGKYKYEASAYGASLGYIDSIFENI